MTDQAHPHTAPGPGSIRTVNRDELKARLDRKDDVKLVMALPRWEFEAKHISESLHFDSPDELYAAIKPDDQVVVYCSQVTCTASIALPFLPRSSETAVPQE